MRCVVAASACISVTSLCWGPVRGCENSTSGASETIETPIYVGSLWSSYGLARALMLMLPMRFASMAGVIERLRAATAA